MMRLVLAVLVSTSSCGRAPAATIANRTTTETIAAQLTREIGAGHSVAIVGGPSGLRAISSDGARQRVLVPGAVPWVIVDPRSNVVWFDTADAHSIRAIDLDATTKDPAPVEVVVTGLPKGGAITIAYPTESRGSDDPPGMIAWAAMIAGYTYESSAMFAHVGLLISTEPSLQTSASMMYGMQDSDTKLADDIKSATISGRAFALALAKRADHRRPEPPTAPEMRVAGIDPKSCDQTSPNDCGRAEPIAGTRYWRVVVQTVCGDGCGRIYRLYDSAAKQFLPDEHWTHELVDAWVAPDGSAFVVNGRVIRFDGGPIAATPEDDKNAHSGGGWIGGGIHYGL